MKIIKFIITVALIFSICFCIPCFIHENMNVDKYYTTAENAIAPGPIGYIGAIMQDENITPKINEKLSNLVNEYNRINNGKRKDYNTLLFIVEMLLGISIIVIGIILLKITNKKLLALAFILSGTLSIIGYIFFFYVYVIFL